MSSVYQIPSNSSSNTSIQIYSKKKSERFERLRSQASELEPDEGYDTVHDHPGVPDDLPDGVDDNAYYALLQHELNRKAGFAEVAEVSAASNGFNVTFELPYGGTITRRSRPSLDEETLLGQICHEHGLTAVDFHQVIGHTVPVEPVDDKLNEFELSLSCDEEDETTATSSDTRLPQTLLRMMGMGTLLLLWAVLSTFAETTLALGVWLVLPIMAAGIFGPLVESWFEEA